ncbi:sulfatase [Halovenus sp. HT40]|uniref:sulfatase n=1 Tax=Halovenus sp. HT40 TaxID=3126691 RepID=UPI00300F43D2
MSERSPSNVLFVVLDTVRKDHLTPYGYDRETTPELGKFAEDATVFENAVAPAPWTLPVHASMFTGRYPTDHGADQTSPYLDDVATLASVLNTSGYDTACYSSNAWITPYTHLTRGFEHQDSFFEVLPGDVLSGPLASAWKTINDNDTLQSIANRLVHLGAKAHSILASGEGADSKTGSVIDRTQSFIDDADDDWFAFINLMDAHLPYYPPEEYREEFAPGVDPDDVCQNSKEFNSGARDIDDEEWEDIRSLYDAELAHMDAELGRLLDWLRETGRFEDTTIVVCADHGELHGEHDLYGHEFALYEQLTNVPLIVSHPDIEEGRREDLVELIDLYHTLLDAAGVETTRADREAVPLDRTRSLLSAEYREFAEPSDPGQAALTEAEDDYAFVEYAQPLIELHHLEEKASEAGITLPDDHRGYATLQAARGERGKYIRADRIPDEGYRLDDDPDESDSLDPDDDERVAEAQEVLERFGEEIDAPWLGEGDAGGPTDPDEVLDDADEQTRERLRDLGYLE